MLHPQSLPITPRRRIIIDRIPIIRIRPVRKRRRELPHTIARDTRLAHHRALPLWHILFPQRHTRRRVLFQHDRFPCCFSDRVVLRDPFTAPGIVVTPLVRVEMEGPVVDGGDSEVLDEIDAFVAAIGVGAVAPHK